MELWSNSNHDRTIILLSLISVFVRWFLRSYYSWLNLNEWHHCAVLDVVLSCKTSNLTKKGSRMFVIVVPACEGTATCGKIAKLGTKTDGVTKNGNKIGRLDYSCTQDSISSLKSLGVMQTPKLFTQIQTPELLTNTQTSAKHPNFLPNTQTSCQTPKLLAKHPNFLPNTQTSCQTPKFNPNTQISSFFKRIYVFRFRQDLERRNNDVISTNENKLVKKFIWTALNSGCICQTSFGFIASVTVPSR